MDNEPKLVEESGKCHFCDEEVGSENYCYGCKVYVCDGCDSPYGVTGPNHKPQDHADAKEEFENEADGDDEDDE